MLILLPPSEGKADNGGTGKFKEHHPKLTRDVRAITKHAQSLSDVDLMKFYSAKTSEKANEIHTLNRAVLGAPCLPAIERYTGVVYQYIDFASISKKRAAKNSIHVVSGLFGLVSGDTMLPLYKLPMNPWLQRYWKEKNTQRLSEARGRKKVLSLLSQTYAKALDLDDTITVEFRVQGGKKSAGHFGKAIKGRFVRFLIENGVTDPRDFDAFREEGYKFNGSDFVQQ